MSMSHSTKYIANSIRGKFDSSYIYGIYAIYGIVFVTKVGELETFKVSSKFKSLKEGNS